MARKQKIDNAILKRLKRKEESKRKVELLETRKYFLLFCEGSRTEPMYFESLACNLPRNSVNVEVDPKGGLNTLSLVNHAIKSLPKYQRAEVIFI